MMRAIILVSLVSVFWIWHLQSPQPLPAQTLFEEAEAVENEYFAEDKYFVEIVPFIPVEEKSIECLATNIYHEARSESEISRMAVGWVVLNRVHSDRFPDTVCEVVYQGRVSRWHLENTGKVVPLRHQCQFSWYCDGKSDRIYDRQSFEEARAIAVDLILNYSKYEDPTSGALWYHADYVNPNWASDYIRTGQFGSHIFYRE